MLSIAWQNLRQDRGRTLIGVGGTALALVLMILIGAILVGTLRESVAYMDRVGADVFVAQTDVSNMITGVSVVPAALESEVARVPNVKRAVAIYGTPYSFKFKGKSMAAYLVGFDPKKGLGGPWAMAGGSQVAKDGEIVLDGIMAKGRGIAVGDRVPLSGKTFKVVGLSAETNSPGSQYMFMSLEDAASLMSASGMVSYILVEADNGTTPEQIRNAIKRRVHDVSVYTREEFVQDNSRIIGDLIAPPLKLMQGVSFAVGLMVIALTVYTGTLSRAKEYALLKAVGARNHQLYSIVLYQSVMNGALGLLLGGLLSIGAASVVNRVGMGVTASIEPEVVIRSAVLALVMSVAASVIPVQKIASIDPAVAFRR